MNKIQRDFCELLKSAYSIEDRNRMDDNYHILGTKADCATIYNRHILPQFEKMFSTDFGGRGQAYSIRSSAIMAYNFFHWIDIEHPLEIDGVGVFNEVMFETPLRTLSTRPSSAKMDVVLLNRNESTAFLIESKLTEHFANKSFSMPTAYREARNYFSEHDGKQWAADVRYFDEKLRHRKGYCEGVKQEMCHLIGIEALSSGYLECAIPGNFRLIFRNAVFNPNCLGQFYPYDAYAELYAEFKKRMSETHRNIDIDIIDYDQIWKAICRAQPADGDRYRKFIWNRYMQFSRIR